jgi:type I restriction enzyme M protein
LATNGFSDKVSFIWSVADLLRGDYKAHEYGSVILPLTVLRRLDQVLAPTREAVWKANKKYAGSPDGVRDRMLLKASRQSFYNRSKLDFERLLADPAQIAQNLVAYIHGFSKNARDIVENFRFEAQIERLEKGDLLYLVVQKFAAIDLHPDRVDNHQMGSVFEELIRKFAEQSNETAGEHFTPREVIRLMVNLLMVGDGEALRRPGVLRTVYDPACGTGGMLSVAEEYLADLNPDAALQVFGQELNPESYAICKADMLIKGQDADAIKRGNSFSDDGHSALHVDYLISNPPFGVEWTKAERVVRDEHDKKGFAGRFGPGLPRKNDGSLLFLLHMLSKMKPPEQGGSRLAIVFNGSPLFTGAAGSGESEIRRYLLERDLLEAIVAMPDQLFYNTGINTYVWVVTNRKAPERRGKVQLVNGVRYFQKMRKSLGDKRKELGEGDIETLVRLYADCEEGREVKLFANEDFGFHRITVERPLKLNFQASDERLARLADERAWQNLLKSKKKDATKRATEIADGERVQGEVAGVLGQLDPDRLYKDRAAFLKDLKAAAKAEGVTIAAPVRKAVLSALAERDEAAEVCKDKQGNPEPDPDLRDNENVPLTEDIGVYMEREVLPHVPDAWVDESKTKVGYEIPFTRHFYEYAPPRPLAEIEAEIRELEDEIRGMLDEVLA